jgi:glycosyltransferase involved in cell wall biosynthesis
MPPITALLHTTNDALRLGRALETLLPCAEILIVDHHSSDATRRIARAYGARIVAAESQDAEIQDKVHRYLDLASHDWIFCMKPAESINENLQASLFEWSALPSRNATSSAGSGLAFSVFVREQIGEHWVDVPAPETRLVPRGWPRWLGRLPAPEPSTVALEGQLLRFALS